MSEIDASSDLKDTYEKAENNEIGNVSQSKSLEFNKSLIESSETDIKKDDTSPQANAKISSEAQSSNASATPVMQMMQGQPSVLHNGHHYTVTSQGMIAIPQQAFSQQPINIMRTNDGHLQLISQQPYLPQYFNQQTLMFTPLGGQHFSFQPRANSGQNTKNNQQILCSIANSSIISPVKSISVVNSSATITSTTTTTTTDKTKTTTSSSSKPSVATVMPQMKQSVMQTPNQKSVVIAVPASGTNQPFVVTNKTPQHFGQLIRLSNGQQVIVTQAGIPANQAIFQQLPIPHNTQFLSGNPSGVFIRSNTPIQQVQATTKKENNGVLPKIISRKSGGSLNSRNRAKPKVLSKATAAQRTAAIIAGVIQQSTVLQSTENPLITAKTVIPVQTTLASSAPGSQMTSSVINGNKKSQDQTLKSTAFVDKPQNAVSPLKIVDRSAFEDDDAIMIENNNFSVQKSSPVSTTDLKVPSIPVKKEPYIRPDVLIHVIDGMVLCESKEPLDNNFDMIGLTNLDIDSPEKDDNTNSDSCLKTIEKLEEISTIENLPPVNKCEICGKYEKGIKFKRSGRFCSLSCAKRYNVLCSKRIPGNIDSDKSKNDSDSIKESKRKSYLKRKLKRSQNRCRLDGSPIKRESNKAMFTTSDDSDNEKLNIRKLATKASSTANTSSSDTETKLPCSSTSFSPINTPNQLSPISSSMVPDVTTPPQPTNHPSLWSVNDVYAFVKNVDGCQAHAETFKQEQIDGQALMLLKHEHLMSTIGMKLGPALKISDLIKKISSQ